MVHSSIAQCQMNLLGRTDFTHPATVAMLAENLLMNASKL